MFHVLSTRTSLRGGGDLEFFQVQDEIGISGTAGVWGRNRNFRHRRGMGMKSEFPEPLGYGDEIGISGTTGVWGRNRNFWNRWSMGTKSEFPEPLACGDEIGISAAIPIWD